jgi:hypothetical protein
MDTQDKKTKRIIVEVPVLFHNELKIEATYRNMNLKQYVTEAILEKMKRELLYRK